MPSFVYDIAIEEIVSQVSSVLNISKDLFYSTTRNHQGSLGRAVVAYFGKELGGHCFKEISDHFHRDPVVMSQGIKRLEKKISDDETIAKAIAKLREALTRDKKPPRGFHIVGGFTMEKSEGPVQVASALFLL